MRFEIRLDLGVGLGLRIAREEDPHPVRTVALIEFGRQRLERPLIAPVIAQQNHALEAGLHEAGGHLFVDPREGSADRLIVPGNFISSSEVGENGITGATSALPSSRAIRSPR